MSLKHIIIFLKKYKKPLLLVCFIVICLYAFQKYKNYYLRTNNLTTNIKDAIYVGTGVVINRYNILVNKELIDDACIGKYSGIMGKIFAMDKTQTIPMQIIARNKILNTYVLSTKTYKDKFQYHSYFDYKDSNKTYKVGNNVVVPSVLNKAGYFNFHKAKIINEYSSNFTIALKKKMDSNKRLGLPIFNEKFFLIGNVRSINKDFYKINKKDVLFAKSNIKTNYYANKASELKLFLDNNGIYYETIANNFNLKNSKYKVEDSVVDIICIKRY